MARMASPDGSCIGIDVQTERGSRRYDGRVFEVSDPRHIRMLRAEGAFLANAGGTPRASGFPCACCGFVAYFKTCGRCGALWTPASDGEGTHDTDERQPS
jgi:hypothetical protein